MTAQREPAAVRHTSTATFQSVCISEGPASDPKAYLAPDVTYTDLVVVDRETLQPYASMCSHHKQAAPHAGTHSTGKSTSGSTPYTPGLESPFTAQDVGRQISGTNIPDGSTIATYSVIKSIELSQTATGTSSNGVLPFIIERPREVQTEPLPRQG